MDYSTELPARLVDSARTVAESFFFNIINMLPNLLIALVLFVVGWGAGSIFGHIVRKLLKAIKFEEYLKSHGLEDALGKVQITDVVVQLVKYYIWLVFLQQAIAQIQLGAITTFISSALYFAPVVIGALAIVVVAALFGEWVREKCLETGKEPYLKTVGEAAKYLIIFLSVISGLDTIGFNTTIIKSVIIGVLNAVSLGAGGAVAIAFGLGGQETAKDILKSFRKVFHF